MKKLLAALAAFAGALALNAEVPPAEKILPDDTLAVLSVPDCAKSHDLNTQSPQMQFWRDPAMKPFTEKFIAKLNAELTGPLQHDLGINFSNYAALAQGQFTLAIVQNGWTGTTNPLPGWIFLLDARTNSGLLKTNLAELKQKWSDAGKPSKSEKIRDVDFTVLMLSSNDLPATLKKLSGDSKPQFQGDAPADADAKKDDAPKTELYIGQKDSLLVAGSSPKILERILANLAGDQTGTLNEQAGFAANSALFHDATAFGWLNAKTLVDIATKVIAARNGEDTGKASPLPVRPEKIFSATGLGALRTIAFSVHPSSEGSLGEIFFTVPESERTGLFKILAGEPHEATPPVFVPADAVKFTRWRFGGKKTWDDLEKMMNDISPQMLTGFNFFLQATAKSPDADVKKDIVANLGGDVIQYQKSPRSKNIADIAAPPSLLLLGSPQPDKLLEALKPLLAMANRRGDPPADREFLGHKIYSVKMPAAQMASGENGPERSLNFAAANGYLCITMSPVLLEEFLRAGDTPAKPLRDAVGLRDAFAKVTTDGTCLVAYENQRETMRVAFDLYRQLGTRASTTSAESALGKLSGQNFFKDWADVSLLPDFDSVATYFNYAVSTLNASADGISFKIFAPRPPEMEK